MTDVLIVGGGPAGLTMSLLLARHGVDALLVERRPGPSPLPRARGIHARAGEILRVLGVLDDLRSVALPIRSGVEFRTVAAAPPEREWTFPAEPSPASPCDGVAVAQDVLEEVLRSHTTGMRDNSEVVGLDVGADHVTASLSSGPPIRARYLVAADGARSFVRSHLGIPMTGPADLGRQRAVYFRADLSPWLGDRPRGLYFLTAVGGVLFWTHPDDRWVLSVPAGAAPDDLLEKALGARPSKYEILGVREWTAAARNADAYRRGPVFLTGDAAHRFPPAGATGVSTAMHDVHNLAWKLADVLAGRADPALLDTYEPERHPVAERNVAETTAEWHRFTDPGAIVARGRDLRQIDMGYQYRSAAIVPDGSPDADPPASTYTPSATPGCRAPHVWLAPGRSTIDLFDRDAILLTGPAAPAPPALLRREILPDPAAYGLTDEGAALVRPDGFVAWRSPGRYDAADLHKGLSAIWRSRRHGR